jgi:hypothetical protein
MTNKPSVSQLLWRAALTGMAAVLVLAACDLSERKFGFQVPWAAQGAALFMLFFFTALIPFRQPNKA